MHACGTHACHDASGARCVLPCLPHDRPGVETDAGRATRIACTGVAPAPPRLPRRRRLTLASPCLQLAGALTAVGVYADSAVKYADYFGVLDWLALASAALVSICALAALAFQVPGGYMYTWPAARKLAAVGLSVCIMARIPPTHLPPPRRPSLCAGGACALRLGRPTCRRLHRLLRHRPCLESGSAWSVRGQSVRRRALRLRMLWRVVPQVASHFRFFLLHLPSALGGSAGVGAARPQRRQGARTAGACEHACLSRWGPGCQMGGGGLCHTQSVRRCCPALAHLTRPAGPLPVCKLQAESGPAAVPAFISSADADAMKDAKVPV